MPTYRVSAPAELLPVKARAALAEEITATHSRLTGAPRYFVQVLFEPRAPEDQYIAGKIQKDTQIFIAGTIRAGRSAAQKTALIAGFVSAAAKCLNVAQRQIWVYLSELPATQMAEFGEKLPVAGGEDAWFAALPREQRDYMSAMDTPKKGERSKD